MNRLLRPIVGTSITVAAAAVAITVVLAGAPGHAATAPEQKATAVSATAAPKLSPAELASIHKLVSTKQGREKFYQAFQNSFGNAANVGAGPLATPGTTRLVLSWGFSGAGGEHFWIIASYADILSKALDRAVPYCIGALSGLIDPIAAAVVCKGVDVAIDRLASGYGRLSNHGVWAAVYFWPTRWGVYRW
jgi:hypothetical protein